MENVAQRTRVKRKIVPLCGIYNAKKCPFYPVAQCTDYWMRYSQCTEHLPRDVYTTQTYSLFDWLWYLYHCGAVPHCDVLMHHIDTIIILTVTQVSQYVLIMWHLYMQLNVISYLTVILMLQVVHMCHSEITKKWKNKKITKPMKTTKSPVRGFLFNRKKIKHVFIS